MKVTISTDENEIRDILWSDLVDRKVGFLERGQAPECDDYSLILEVDDGQFIRVVYSDTEYEVEKWTDTIDYGYFV